MEAGGARFHPEKRSVRRYDEWEQWGDFTVPKAAWEILMDQVTVLATAVDILQKAKSSPSTTDKKAGSEENRGLNEKRFDERICQH